MTTLQPASTPVPALLPSARAQFGPKGPHAATLFDLFLRTSADPARSTVDALPAAPAPSPSDASRDDARSSDAAKPAAGAARSSRSHPAPGARDAADPHAMADLSVADLAAAELRGVGDSRRAPSDPPAPPDADPPLNHTPGSRRTHRPAERTAVDHPAANAANARDPNPPGPFPAVSRSPEALPAPSGAQRGDGAAFTNAIAAAIHPSGSADRADAPSAPARADRSTGPIAGPASARGVGGGPTGMFNAGGADPLRHLSRQTVGASPGAKALERPDPTLTAQVSRGLALALRQGEGAAVLRLAPAALGEVRVEIAVEDRTLRAVITPSSESARALLNDSLDGLRAALEARGLAVDRLMVAEPPRSDPPMPEASGHDSPSPRHDPGREQGENPGRHPGGQRPGSDPDADGARDAGPPLIVTFDPGPTLRLGLVQGPDRVYRLALDATV